jgi:hypothetical protein
MDEAEKLRDRAARSLFQSDRKAREALLSVAQELEERAAQLKKDCS